eukprot:557926-Pleurochrysis_carterae.AAC.1
MARSACETARGARAGRACMQACVRVRAYSLAQDRARACRFGVLQRFRETRMRRTPWSSGKSRSRVRGGVGIGAKVQGFRGQR